MSPVVAFAAMACWVGTTLLLSEVRWFSRLPLVDRIRPYVAGGWDATTRPSSVMSWSSMREVAGPLATSLGDRMARLAGINDSLATRLERTHSALDPAGARLRQLAWTGGAVGAAGLLTIAMAAPPAFGALLVLGAPALAFLAVERQLTRASDEWRERLFLELPVVSEQIAMLIASGYSLGTALDRIATRGSGACARDLARVGRRVRQGLSEAEALAEWAALADVPAVERLVSVLALNRDTGDLSRLVADEARAVRREAQRQLAASIDRRAQQVWIPVTVATLVPGTIFLAVPFVQALQLFAGS
jgi:Flp pilus assembly protein TadB